MDSWETARQEIITPSGITIVRPQEFDSQFWPVQAGDYQVFDAGKPAALALLSGVDIDDACLQELSKTVAIVGSLTTENLGVEHVVKNLIANPFIRHLVIFGKDVDGHFPGDALIQLSANGMNQKQRIVGACGARPVLKNLTQAEVKHFKKQISVHNLMKQVDTSILIRVLEQIGSLKEEPYEAGLKVELVEVVQARPAKRLKLDPAGYFVIMVMKAKKTPIVVEHYSNDGRLSNVIEGEDAATICATLTEKNLVSQIDHAAYLGRELIRAEMSLRFGFKYVQEGAQTYGQCQPETHNLVSPVFCRDTNSRNERIC